MDITLRGLRVVDVGIIYPILGKVLFQISFTNYENSLAYNTSLVTSGNSGLPRLNSSRKSSDIPLPTQSPIWVNPMGPITLTFGKKCYSVTTPGDNLQISSTKRAFIECMFLPRRLRSLHQGHFPDLIDSRVGNYATAWMDSWRVTQQILYDFSQQILDKEHAGPTNEFIRCQI